MKTSPCQAAACQRLGIWHTPYTRCPRGHYARLLPTKNRPRATHTLRTPFVASAHRSGCKNLWNQNGTPDAVFRTRCHRTLYETDNALLESMAAPYVFGPRLVSAPGAATVFLRSVQLAYSSSQPWASPEPESVSCFFLAATFWATSGGNSVNVGVCFSFRKRFNLRGRAPPLFDLNWVNALFREHCRGSCRCELRASGCELRARGCCELFQGTLAKQAMQDVSTLAAAATAAPAAFH